MCIKGGDSAGKKRNDKYAGALKPGDPIPGVKNTSVAYRDASSVSGVRDGQLVLQKKRTIKNLDFETGNWLYIHINNEHLFYTNLKSGYLLAQDTQAIGHEK